ncbi:MAG: metallophosphoesterase [Patescibacteria group bacterium]|jgi:hypothetical protein
MYLLIALAVLILIYGYFIEPRWLAVRKYREPLIAKPTTWLKIAFLSDFHAGGAIPANWWERIVLETNAHAPDIVVLGGDFVVDHASAVSKLAPLKDLRAPDGVFFVLGNHDFLDRPQDIRTAFVDMGFADLTNRSIRLKQEGKEVEIQGLDDHWYGAPQPFARSNPVVPHILIAHEPDVMLDLEHGKTDLVLVGHTHGGQIRLPILGAPWIPAKLGRFADGGRKMRNGVPFVMGRGLGQERGRPRIGARPEIVIVEVGV